MCNVFVFLSLQYMGNVDSWCKACGEVDLPSELQDLEDAIHHHQGLYEHITAAYSEVNGTAAYPEVTYLCVGVCEVSLASSIPTRVCVCMYVTTPFPLPQVSQDGKVLLDKLQRPLTPGGADSLTASANYSKAVHHVLDVIHEVLHHQRQLENIWQHRKVRLHQRLQLCVFQQDVQQVWTSSDPVWLSWEEPGSSHAKVVCSILAGITQMIHILEMYGHTSYPCSLVAKVTVAMAMLLASIQVRGILPSGRGRESGMEKDLRRRARAGQGRREEGERKVEGT